MNILSYEEYEDYKIKFVERHGDWKVDTSPMDEYGRYHKTYVCEDGATMIEVNEPEYATAEATVTVKGVEMTIKQEVKLFRSETWSTDNPNSVYHYERFERS